MSSGGGRDVPDVSEGPLELRARDLEVFKIRDDLSKLRKVVRALGALRHRLADVRREYRVKGLRVSALGDHYHKTLERVGVLC